jgi:signal transduction histidine kinase/CheY-like chemotaxis protein/streptogramin lyase
MHDVRPAVLFTRLASLAIGCAIAAVACAFSPPAFAVGAAHAPFSVEIVGTDRGLPHDNVTSVRQTRDGYLWIGTSDGLARFDGIRFVSFYSSNTPGLPNHAITCLYEENDVLWIGTESGLVRYESGRFQAVGLTDSAISGVGRDADGVLWVGTYDAGLFRYRENKYEAVDDKNLPGKAVNAVFSDSTGRLWIGLKQYHGVVSCEHGQFHAWNDGEIFKNEVLAFAETPEGALWFGTAEGLVGRREGTFVRYTTANGLADNRVCSLYADAEGALWIGTTELQRIQHGDLATIEKIVSMRAKIFHATCRDREGNVWVGTGGDGLLRVREPRQRFMTLGAKGTSTGARTVMQDPNGAILIAQGALGLTRIETDGKLPRTPTHTVSSENEVVATWVTRNGDTWVGNRGSLEIHHTEKVDTFPEYGGARALYEDRHGDMWLGFQEGGVIRWHDGRFTSLPMPAGARHCTPQSFTENSQGEIFIGTWRNGIVEISPDGSTRLIDRTSGAPTDEMRCAYADSGDTVWIGSRGRGLGFLDHGRAVFPAWTSDLLDSTVTSIIEDDTHNLWLGTPRGIFMTGREELLATMTGSRPLSRLKIVSLVDDGAKLEDLMCFPNIWKTREGQIWFTSKKGVVLVDPTVVSPNRIPPTVHIEHVLANGQELPLGSTLDLAADTRELMVQYTGLSFTAPARVRFLHRLEGFDKDWVPGDQRFAYYTNLKPGRYRFQVIAANADGVWNDQGEAIRFHQKAHLYQTGWAYALATVVALAIVTGAYRWRVASLKRDKERLERGIADHTRELRAAKEQAEAATRARTEFLENISHEIRNPLNGIIGLVGMMREAQPDQGCQEIARSLNACAKSLARVFDAVLNFSKLEHGHVAVRENAFSLSALVNGVADLFRTSERGKSIQILITKEGDEIDRVVGDEEKIETILSNFISNALKHAPGSPIELCVQFDHATEYGADVTFLVTDHGPGIPAEEQEAVFQKFVRGQRAKQQRASGTGLGLATCRALAELLGGHVAVESEPGQGATFFLTLRLKRDRLADRAAAKLETAEPVTHPFALIVEDQPYNQIVVQRLAQRLGYVSDVAASASEALAKAASARYDVVFLDWELPDMNGDKVARALRERPGGENTIIIATTAHENEDIRRQCAAAGMDGFALKPFELQTISSVLSEARARRGQIEAADIGSLDTRVFSMVGQNDPRQTGEAAALYVDILDRELATIEDAFGRKDRSTVAKAAHRLKAHAGLVDGAELRAIADRIQREAMHASESVLTALRRDLVARAQQLRAQLTHWQNRPRATG